MQPYYFVESESSVDSLHVEAGCPRDIQDSEIYYPPEEIMDTDSSLAEEDDLTETGTYYNLE